MHANQQRNFSVIFSTGRNQRLNQLFLSFLLFCCMFCKHCNIEIETDLKYLHDLFIWDSLEKKVLVLKFLWEKNLLKILQNCTEHYTGIEIF